jgi:hypothetical protein
MYEFDSSGSNHKVYQSIEANGIPVVWISELVLVRESDHVYAGTIGDGSRFHFDADMRPRYVETPNQSVKRVEFETCTGTDSDWMLSRVSRAR